MNRAYSTILAPTTPMSGASTNVVGAKLTCQGSGIFYVWCVINDSGAMGGDPPDIVRYAVTAYTDATPGVPLSFIGAAQGGPGTSGIALPSQVAVTDNGAYASVAGGGIQLTGATVGRVLPPVTIRTMAHAGVGDSFTWSNAFGSSDVPTQESPYPHGVTVAILVSVFNTNAGRPIGNCIVGLIELP